MQSLSFCIASLWMSDYFFLKVNLLAISSKVFPFVSGSQIPMITMNVSKTTRKIKKTYGPINSCKNLIDNSVILYSNRLKY